MKRRLLLLSLLAFGLSRAAAADAKTAPAASGPVTTPPAVAGPTPSTAAVPARTTAPVVAVPRDNAPAAGSSASFDSFRIISDRNIFNPNRTGRRERSDDQPPRVDAISLVGTMDSDRGLRAFFDGSDKTYQRALHVGETVEKFKVLRIAPDVVDLERDGKSLSVRVGQQLRRPEGADWTLVGEDIVRREAEAKAAAENRVDPSAPSVIPANADDITRRMMERRNKELKR